MIDLPAILLCATPVAFWLAYLPAYALLFLSPLPFGRQVRKALRPLVVAASLLIFCLVVAIPFASLIRIAHHMAYWDSDLVWRIVDSSPAASLVVSTWVNAFIIARRQRLCRETRPNRRTMRRLAMLLAACSIPLAWIQIHLTLSPQGSGGLSAQLLLALAELFALSTVLLYLDARRPLPSSFPRMAVIGRRLAFAWSLGVAVGAGCLMFLVPNL